MFGIGSTELLVILVVALVVLGPKSLPGIAKTVGKVMGEFRRVTTDFQRTMNAEIAQEEHDKRKKEAEKELFGQDDATESKEKESVAIKDAPKQDTSATPTNETMDAPDASTAKHSPGTVENPLEHAVAKAQEEARSCDAVAPNHVSSVSSGDMPSNAVVSDETAFGKTTSDNAVSGDVISGDTPKADKTKETA